MALRMMMVCVALSMWGHDALGQARSVPNSQSSGIWLTPDGTAVSPASSNASSNASGNASSGESIRRVSRARVTSGLKQLPNQHGQLWREYDISPYTTRVTSTARPEQAVVDWILRETGYEVWHGEPFAVLSVRRESLLVYHTPEMQALVADIVDRFVSSEAETSSFEIRVITVRHPNWRARAQQLMRPVQVQTPGVQAWLLQPEDASVLMVELQRRSDFREHGSPHLLVNNGQSKVISATQAKNYARGVILRPNTWPGFESEMAVIDEGYTLEFSPLLSVDEKVIDAAIRCEVDQIEKMVPVMVDVPTTVSHRQRAKVEIPQMTQFRFHERFRWPVGQVLLVEMGMVPLPVPEKGKTLVPGIPISLPSGPPRADLLIFVESKGKMSQAPRVTTGRRSKIGR